MAITTYEIQFKDIKERLVKITIVDNDADPGDTYILTPGQIPLVISEDDTNDPLIPIRSTNAQITVSCTNAEMINVQNNNQWYVYIRREGTLLWIGALRAEMMEMEYSPIADEITYIADDILGILKNINVSRSLQKTILSGLLYRTYTMLDNSIPVINTTSKPWQTLSTLSAQAQNWLHTEDNDEGIAQSVQDNRNVSEEDVITFLGVCARYWDGKLYLGSLFGTKFYNNQSEMSLSVIDGSQMTWTGFHTINWEQGMGHISLESGGRPIDNEKLPSISSAPYRVSEYGYVAPQTAHDTGGYNCFIRLLRPDVNSGITLSQSTLGNPGNIWGEIGAHAVDVDVWSQENNKYNFSFSRYCAVVGQGLNLNGTTTSMAVFSITDTTSTLDVYNRSKKNMLNGLTSPLISIVSLNPIYSDNGGFTVKIEGKSSNVTTIVSSGNSYRKIDNISQTLDFIGRNIYVICSLSYGNKYWNGQSWQTGSCKFLYVGADILIKNVDMMFEGEIAAMPTSGVSGGFVTFNIYGIYSAEQTQVEADAHLEYTCTWAPETIIFLSTLDIEYNPSISVIENMLENTQVFHQRTANFPATNEKNITMNLCSNIEIKENWGFVYNGNSKISTLHWPKLRQSWSPERLVLKKNTLALARNRQYAIISAESEYEHLPFRRILLNGRTWYPLSVKTNWQNCSSEIKMMDITDIMAELPAVGTDEESAGGNIQINVSASGQSVTLTLAESLPVATNILWSTIQHSGTTTIPSGSTTVTFNAGEIIQEERDIDFVASAESGSYTYYFVWT